MKTLTILALITATAFSQGPLAPPGAPAPTMKTLDEIHAKVADAGEKRTPISSLPFTISTSGSYYLAANLTSAGGDGITVTAGNVTIDLNGFTLIGAGSGKGISFTTADDVKIHCGSLRSWATGIESINSARTNIEKVNVHGCTGTGITQTGGGNCMVRDCTISFCGGLGIRVAGLAVITGNVVNSITLAGIRLEGSRGEVRGNTITESNVGVELFTGRNCVEGNTLKSNILGLNVLASGNSIRRNSLSNNGGNTIIAGNDAAPFEPASTSTNPHANISF